MTWEAAGLFLDLVLVLLLGAVIGYAFVLNKKLTVLRDGREEMERLVGDLGDSLVRAQANLDALKGKSEERAGSLQSQLDRADSLADDLAYLVRKSDLAAQKLERANTRRDNPLTSSPVPTRSRDERTMGSGVSGAGRSARSFESDRVSQESDQSPPIARELEDKLREIAEQAEARSQTIPSPNEEERPLSNEQSELLKVLQSMR